MQYDDPGDRVRRELFDVAQLDGLLDSFGVPRRSGAVYLPPLDRVMLVLEVVEDLKGGLKEVANRVSKLFALLFSFLLFDGHIPKDSTPANFQMQDIVDLTAAVLSQKRKEFFDANPEVKHAWDEAREAFGEQLGAGPAQGHRHTN